MTAEYWDGELSRLHANGLTLAVRGGPEQRADNYFMAGAIVAFFGILVSLLVLALLSGVRFRRKAMAQGSAAGAYSLPYEIRPPLQIALLFGLMSIYIVLILLDPFGRPVSGTSLERSLGLTPFPVALTALIASFLYANRMEVLPDRLVYYRYGFRRAELPFDHIATIVPTLVRGGVHINLIRRDGKKPVDINLVLYDEVSQPVLIDAITTHSPDVHLPVAVRAIWGGSLP